MVLLRGVSDRCFCSRCSGRCVSYMDHHCPFTHNCVGHANFVHYYLFLLWTTMGAVLASYLSLPAFLNCVMYESSATCHSATYQQTLPPNHAVGQPHAVELFCNRVSKKISKRICLEC